MTLRDKLPDIHITVDDPLHFLQRMADISETLRPLTVTRRCDGSTGRKFIVLLKFIDASRGNGNSVQLFSVEGDKVIVVATIGNDEFTTYEYYRQLAEDIIKPPLRIYNREEHKRYRMTVTPKEKLQPKLAGTSARLFEAFTETANKSNLHSSDWWLFYEFVRASRGGQSLPDNDHRANLQPRNPRRRGCRPLPLGHHAHAQRRAPGHGSLVLQLQIRLRLGQRQNRHRILGPKPTRAPAHRNTRQDSGTSTGEQPNSVIAHAPAEGHSKKPAIFAEMIEQMFPNASLL